jgi:glycosyltransferase involved in cell wall biosynthesis
MSDTPLRTPELLSVVAPVFNEDELVEEFIARATAAVADYEFELVLVNDGSSDRTAELLDEAASRDPRVRVIHLSVTRRRSPPGWSTPRATPWR